MERLKADLYVMSLQAFATPVVDFFTSMCVCVCVWYMSTKKNINVVSCH
jgi:hypothetical protein